MLKWMPVEKLKFPALSPIASVSMENFEDGSDYYLNGNAVNYPIVSSDKPLDISVRAFSWLES